MQQLRKKKNNFSMWLNWRNLMYEWLLKINCINRAKLNWWLKGLNYCKMTKDFNCWWFSASQTLFIFLWFCSLMNIIYWSGSLMNAASSVASMITVVLASKCVAIKEELIKLQVKTMTVASQMILIHL